MPAQLLAELRATPACGARDPPARCCALAAEAAAGRCHCAAGEYRGVGAALAAVRAHCRAPRAGPAGGGGAAAGGGARPGLDEGGGGAGGEVTSQGGGDERFGGQPRMEGLREEVERAVVGQGAHRGRQAWPAAEAGRGRGKRAGAGGAARGLPHDAPQTLARRARPLGGGQGGTSADPPPAGNASAAGAAGAGGPPPRLFVGVLSAAANADARAAIRETWGADARLHRCGPPGPAAGRRAGAPAARRASANEHARRRRALLRSRARRRLGSPGLALRLMCAGGGRARVEIETAPRSLRDIHSKPDPRWQLC